MSNFHPLRCNRCRQWWTHTCWPTKRYEIMSRICPDCIAKHIPVVP